MRWLKTYLQGMAVGTADLVPGVSGGTVAFLLGIYPRLLRALSRLGPQMLMDFFRQDKKAWWQSYDCGFLAVLVAGALTAVFSLARLFAWLLEQHATNFYAFFTGLLLASCWLLLRSAARARLTWWFNLIVAALALLWFNFLNPLQFAPSFGLFFISGFVAIGVMLLPGISGSLLLLIIGSYEHLVRAVAGLIWPQLLPFAGGILLGLLLFPRIYHWGLTRYQSQIMALFCGLLLGSLTKVWPWQGEQGLYLPETVAAYGLEIWLLLAGLLLVIVPARVWAHDN